MPVNAITSKTIDAPTSVVWEVLDDFPNIAAWNSGIQQSYTTGDTDPTGLGAERRCELGGKKILDERIADYVEGEQMTVEVYRTEGLPVKSSNVVFSVKDVGDGKTEATIDATVEPKIPGFLVSLMGGMLSKQVAKQFGGFLDELESESVRRAPADA